MREENQPVAGLELDAGVDHVRRHTAFGPGHTMHTHQLFKGVADPCRVVHQKLVLRRVLSQVGHDERQHGGDGVQATQKQQRHHAQLLVGAEGLPLHRAVDRQADQIVARRTLAFSDQILEVVAQFGQAGKALRDVWGPGKPVHLVGQQFAVRQWRVGHPQEQFNRKALRNLAHELTGAAPGNTVYQARRELADLQLHFLHAGRCEERVDDAPQVGVQWWIALIGQGRRVAPVRDVMDRIAGELVWLTQHVARHISASHDPVPTVARSVEKVRAGLQ